MPGLGLAKTIALEERLPFRVVDAAFSKELNELVLVGEAPSALYRYDPKSRALKKLALRGEPRQLVVSAEGATAAVLSDSRAAAGAQIDVIDLTALRLSGTFPVKGRLSGIALVQGRLVGFDEDRRDWRSIDLRTRQETVTKLVLQSIGSTVVHPDGNELYAMGASSSSEVGRVELLERGRLEWKPRPMKGAHACGGLWFSADGRRILSGCGTVQQLSATGASATLSFERQVPDLTRLQYVSHAPALRELAVIPGPPLKKRITFPISSDTELRVLNDSDYRLIGQELLPRFRVGNRSFPAHGRTVFTGATGDKYHVLVEADPASGLNEAFAVITVDRGPDRARLPETEVATPEPFRQDPLPASAARAYPSSWRGTTSLQNSELAEAEKYRLGKLTAWALDPNPPRDDVEDEDLTDPEVDPFEGVTWPKSIKVAGDGWTGSAPFEATVKQGPRYDTVDFSSANVPLKCAVAVEQPELLLPMLRTILPSATINAAYVRATAVAILRTQPIILWQLSDSVSKPLDKSRATFVVAVFRGERAAVCAHDGLSRAQEFVDAAAEFLDSVSWAGIQAPDFEELSIVWSRVPNVMLSSLDIYRGHSRARTNITTYGSVDYVAGFNWVEVAMGDTDRLRSRFLFVAPGQKLTMLRDQESLLEGDQNDVLVHAEYRNRQPGQAQDVVLERTDAGKYSLSRRGSPGSVPFAAGGELAGPLALAGKLRAAQLDAGAGKFELDQLAFEPEISTNRAIATRFARQQYDPKGLAIRNERASNWGTVGADGRFDTVTSSKKGSVRFERVQSRGCARPLRTVPAKLRGKIRSACSSR